MVTSVNVVVLAGTIAADPVQRRMPSGEERTEIRLSVPESGRRLLPLPIVACHAEVRKKHIRDLHQGNEVLVFGRLIRRFYRSGAQPPGNDRVARGSSRNSISRHLPTSTVSLCLACGEVSVA